MSDPKQPTIQELLDRIVKLEAENARLRARVDDVQEGLDISMRSATGEFAVLNDALWPVVHKVFPNYFEMKTRMDDLVPPGCADPRADRQRGDKT